MISNRREVVATGGITEGTSKVIVITSLVAALSLALACNGGGGGGGGGGAPAAYKARVADYKAAYGKSDEWEEWMIENHARYTYAFAASSAKPDTITISYRYETGSTFTTDWASEEDHMDAFATMAEAMFPGYDFNFVFEGNTETSYANVIAGIPTNFSRAQGKNIWLYREAIFHHEFGHVMGLGHHYDTDDDIGEGTHMPPGDTECILDKSGYLWCSACRTALGIPLDAGDADAVHDAMIELGSHVVSK